MAAIARFEGDEVLGTKVKITRAGDGLSQALEIEPEVLKQRSVVYVVLECTVGRVAFDPVKDASKGVNRVQTLIDGTATMVAGELVKDVLEEQRLKNEAAAGVGSLNFGEGDEPDAADPPALASVPTPEGGWDEPDAK